LHTLKNQQQREIDRLDEYKMQYIKLLNEEKICPVCSSEIDSSILKLIKENL
jgi:uncharacterized protein (UPF0212 family)